MTDGVPGAFGEVPVPFCGGLFGIARRARCRAQYNGRMADPQTAENAPDWSQLTVELRCPRCGYDLRMLPQPRCPECGLHFEWSDLVAAASVPSSPLFEHQWRRQPARSFLRTYLSALWPPLVWRQTRLEAPPRAIPLTVLAIASLLFYLLCVNAREDLWWWYSNQSQFLGLYPMARMVDGIERTVVLVLPAIATWLALQVFQQTFGRYRLRQGQVFRLVALSWLSLIVWKTMLLGGEAVLNMCVYKKPWLFALCPWLWDLDEVVPLLVFVLALCTGLRMHLRIERGWPMGLLSALLAFVMLVTVHLSAVLFYDALPRKWTHVMSLEWEAAMRAVGEALIHGLAP